jgi:AraC family transcriptional regulator
VTSTEPGAGLRPRAYFWDGGWIGIGRSRARVPPHAHHAVQVTISPEGTVRFRGDGEDEEWRSCQGAVVLPDRTHAFDANGALVAMLFLDPECREGRWLCGTLREPITELPPERFARCLPGLGRLSDQLLSAEDAAELVSSLVRSLCVGPPPTRVLDERVTQALELIRRDASSRIPIEQISKKVFLSPSRFAHLFTEEVGLPFRRYVLWRKLTRALQLIGRGQSLSAVAHASGFSDAAHLTRTFNQMFGIPPSLMVGGSEFFEIPAPFELRMSNDLGGGGGAVGVGG